MRRLPVYGWLLVFILPFFDLAALSPEVAAKPVSVYPAYNWVGSPLERQFTGLKREGDRIAMSAQWGLEDGFRSEDYSVPLDSVLLQFTHLPDMEAAQPEIEKKQKGIRGFWLMLDGPDLSYQRSVNTRLAQLRSYARDHEQEVYGGPTDLTNRSEDDYIFFADFCDVVLIVKGNVMELTTEEAANAYRQLITMLRDEVPGVRIEVVVRLNVFAKDRTRVTALLEALKDDADRFGFIVENGPEPIAVITEVWAQLRS